MKFSVLSNRIPTVSLEKFGNESIKVTNKFVSIDGVPTIPVMGELHFSRVPAERWDEELKKMKEGGIDVVASYVFWIHHQEEPGEFDFSGNRNIRRFVELCHQNGMEFFLRIGPWVHGECRNGGFPDWLYDACGDTIRTLKEPYYSYVVNYLKKIGEQLKGLRLFGIQLENECYNSGTDYFEKLRQLCIENGMEAPLYTATGWGKAVLPDTLLPVYGGYPSEPWTQHILPEEPLANYFFLDNRSGGKIGADIGGSFDDVDSKVGKVPYLTAELGGGNQITYHRRPMFVPEDIEALPICKLGSGCNLLGYYMYHGGLNPIGKTTMQESKATKYINDYPVISYDFQAPLGDNGQMRESYYRLQKLHRFVHSFGSILAPMDVCYPDVQPKDLEDIDTLRTSLRSDGEKGFLFVCNHTRLVVRKAIKDAKIDIEFSDRLASFHLDVPSDSAFILPVGLRFGTLQTELVTAFPVYNDEGCAVFVRIEGLAPTVTMKDGRIFELKSGENLIEGTKVILEEPYHYIPTPLTRINITEQEPTLPADILLGHLDIADQTAEYKVEWAKGDSYIVIYAKGNIAGFYIDGKLVNDFYLYGLNGKPDAFVVDVRSTEKTEGILKIQPYTDSDDNTIYFDSAMEKGKVLPKVYSTNENILKI